MKCVFSVWKKLTDLNIYRSEHEAKNKNIFIDLNLSVRKNEGMFVTVHMIYN